MCATQPWPGCESLKLQAGLQQGPVQARVVQGLGSVQVCSASYEACICCREWLKQVVELQKCCWCFWYEVCVCLKLWGVYVMSVYSCMGILFGSAPGISRSTTIQQSFDRPQIAGVIRQVGTCRLSAAHLVMCTTSYPTPTDEAVLMRPCLGRLRVCLTLTRGDSGVLVACLKYGAQGCYVCYVLSAGGLSVASVGCILMQGSWAYRVLTLGTRAVRLVDCRMRCTLAATKSCDIALLQTSNLVKQQPMSVQSWCCMLLTCPVCRFDQRHACTKLAPAAG